MKYIESNSNSPYFNLALEEYVFDELSQTDDYFILWQNEPSIIVGKYQNTMQEINREFVDKNEIKVVRRLSGGGAVYHDEGNLNFTFIVKQEKLPDFQFRYFSKPIINVLTSMGINAEFTGRNDVTIEGKKFSGNSQYVRKGRIMHHGCIMVESNLTNVVKALKPNDAKFASKSTKSVSSRVTTINANADIKITVDEFKKKLLSEVFKNQDIQRYVLHKSDLDKISQIEKDRYRTWEWNYGKSGTYEYKKIERFEFGTVEVEANVRNGFITAIHFSGDFFGNGDIIDLEDALCGLAIDDNLAENIEAAICPGEYIHGITPKMIESLLR